VAFVAYILRRSFSTVLAAEIAMSDGDEHM